MSQSKKASMTEAVISTAIGFCISMVIQHYVMECLNHSISLTQNFVITGIFTVASIIRSYVLRRIFNAYTVAHQSRLGGFTNGL